MADLRESFPTLENVSTQAGVALGARQEGDAASSINGSIGFSFKDSLGNVVLPQLNASGQVPVTLDIAGDNLYARGENATGSATAVTIATITLTASAVYQAPEMVCSSFRDALFQLIWNNNGAESVLADALVGPGCLSFSVALEKLEFTAGATGTQQLLVKALNQNALSALRATVAVKELP